MTAPGRLGFRILDSAPRLPGDLLVRFRGVASSNLADAIGRFGFMDAGIVSRTAQPLSGQALTVLLRPADNLMLHKALELARPGDVLVVSTGGNMTSAVFGELMCRTAVARHIGGLVVDGAVRDVAELTALGLPVFSRAVCPGGCDKDGPGEINVPVACGGTAVLPGDVVVGDADGVAVVHGADVDSALRQLADLEAREQRRVAEIADGVFFKPDIDETLRKRGVIE